MLTAIEPIGRGTAECESLSSYVQRLAVAHGTRPGQLVFRLLACLDSGQPQMVGQWQRRSRLVGRERNANSFTHADAWVRVLQRVTGRSDLHYLTTRSWDDLFPTRGFQRITQWWCPSCLAEDPVPYQRLAWCLQPVHVCLRHGTALRSRCKKCSRAFPILHERSAVTACPQCGGDLAARDDGIERFQPSEFDLWAAHELGEIIRLTADWHRPFVFHPATALKRLARTARINDSAAFGRFIGVSKITAWYWLTGKARPSLPMVLRVYHRFGRSISEDLSASRSAPPLDVIHQDEMHLARVRKSRKRNWAEIEQRLRAALSDSSGDGTSLAEFSRKVHTAVRTLRVHLPKLCRRLSQQHRARVHKDAKERRDQRHAEIVAAIAGLVDAGIEISQRSISAKLNRPGIFCLESTRRFLRELERSQPATAGKKAASRI